MGSVPTNSRKNNLLCAGESELKPITVLTAAYVAGRHSNRLLWHMTQAYFLTVAKGTENTQAWRRHRDGVRDTFSDLIGLASTLETNEPTALRERLFAAQQAWKQLTEPPDAYLLDVLVEADDQYSRQSGDEYARDRICQRLVDQDIRPIVEAVQKGIGNTLEAQSHRQAFLLGDLIDQAIRRPDVFRHMWDFGGGPLLANEEDVPPELSGEDLASWEPNGNSSVSEDALIQCQREAGDLAPRAGWLSEVQRLCSHLELWANEATDISDFFSCDSRPLRSDLIKAVDQIDSRIRAALDRHDALVALAHWDEPTRERNRFCFEHIWLGTVFKKIQDDIKRRGWEELNSASAVKRAARAFAEATGRDMPPPRANGRRPKK
jgi:hypothetical protein